MTADEMFKELGYEKIENTRYKQITYKFNMDNKRHYDIIFDLDLKQIKIERNGFWFMTYSQYCGILLEDLKAINKKVEELQWN